MEEEVEEEEVVPFSSIHRRSYYNLIFMFNLSILKLWLFIFIQYHFIREPLRLLEEEVEEEVVVFQL
ncbi:MAG: hypothetical protein R2771_07005 [Saprospiraceae bacterium]